jgi:hypothetical protein
MSDFIYINDQAVSTQSAEPVSPKTAELGLTVIRVLDCESLEGLAAKADYEATAVERIGSQAVQHAWQCGKYLLQIKQQIGHGGFVAWLNSDKWGREERVAYKYMTISEMLNLHSCANLTSISDALRICQQEQKPKIRDRIVDALKASGDDGLTDSEIESLIEEKGASVRGRRSELCKDGIVKPTGKKRIPDGTGKAQTVWIVVESEEDAKRAKEQQEKRERDAVAENLANKIIKMDHRTRSAVMRRVNADESIKATKMQKVAKEQRRGEGTAKDHVRTCIVESCHRLSSALQQNGPGTNKRWMTACSVEEKSEIRTFAENLSSMAKTLSDYLSENM